MLEFLPEDDPRLRQPSQKIGHKLTKNQQRMIVKVCKKLESMPEAMAIAAPQVGIPLRFFVARRNPSEMMVVVNPEIVDILPDKYFIDPEGNPILRERSEWEGCLSLPGREFLVSRHVAIKVKFETERGIQKSFIVSNYDAMIFQHEMDHLDGILIDQKCQDIRNIEEEEVDIDVKNGLSNIGG